MALMKKSRRGENVNREHIRSAILCFVDMGLEKGAADEPKTVREGQRVVWVGKRSLQFYNADFEGEFLNYASLDFTQKALSAS
jgi:hypothetical protein